MRAFILHLGEEKARYSDDFGKPYARPRFHYVVRVADSCFLEGFSPSPEDQVARALLREKIAQPHDTIEVRRGDRVVFRARPVSQWADVVVEESVGSPARFARYRERSRNGT